MKQRHRRLLWNGKQKNPRLAQISSAVQPGEEKARKNTWASPRYVQMSRHRAVGSRQGPRILAGRQSSWENPFSGARWQQWNTPAAVGYTEDLEQCCRRQQAGTSVLLALTSVAQRTGNAPSRPPGPALGEACPAPPTPVRQHCRTQRKHRPASRLCQGPSGPRLPRDRGKVPTELPPPPGDGRAASPAVRGGGGPRKPRTGRAPAPPPAARETTTPSMLRARIRGGAGRPAAS